MTIISYLMEIPQMNIQMLREYIAYNIEWKMEKNKDRPRREYIRRLFQEIGP